MNRRTTPFLVALLGGVILFALGVLGIINAALAAFPSGPPISAPPGAQAKTSANDDFDSLPIGLKGVSYSTLVSSGKVHVGKAAAPNLGQSAPWKNPFAPLLNITWGADQLTGSGAGEPAAGIHPTNPLYALVSGNFSLDHTTDGGLTCISIQPPNPHGS